MPPTTAAPIVVYLSSTLTDLEEERKAIKEVLGGTCVVKESYQGSDASLVKKCLDDVGTCEVYVGVIGLRYGFIPPGRAQSITQLEYEQAKVRGLSRHIFIKNEAAVAAPHVDAFTGENPNELILNFRNQLTSGADDEPTPARFSTITDLKLGVKEMISNIQLSRKGGSALMGTREATHPWTVLFEVSIGCVPGTDQQMKAILDTLAQSDQRITTFELSPAQPKEYFPDLDAQSRKSRCVMLMVTASSLSRVKAAAGDIATSVAMVRERSAGVFGLLVDVKPEALPANVKDALSDVFHTDTSEWSETERSATFDKLQQWRRSRAPEMPGGTRVAVPYLVIALKEDEAKSMHADPASLFKKFGAGAGIRQGEFDALSKRLFQMSPDWPKGFYGSQRGDWRPFGPALQTMNEFVLAAARRLTQESGTREKRLLRNAQLALLPYAFDEYLTDRSGSRDNIRRVCDLGCLVLLDEFVLLHPTLREEVDQLLSSNNAAIVSITACDPTLRPLGELLGDLSYLKVGNLLSRFRYSEDLRCELALNSAERLQRWLRLVFPELLTTLGQNQRDPTLNVEDLLDQAV